MNPLGCDQFPLTRASPGQGSLPWRGHFPPAPLQCSEELGLEKEILIFWVSIFFSFWNIIVFAIIVPLSLEEKGYSKFKLW